MALVSIEERNRSLNLYYGADAGSIASPSHDVALYAGDPLTGGVELDSAGGYVRPTITNDGTTWSGASGGATTSALVSFADATAEWTVAGNPAVATHYQLIATDTDDAGDSGLLGEPISVDAAGPVPQIQITVYYDTGA